MPPNSSNSSRTIAAMKNPGESIDGRGGNDTDKAKHPHESSTDEKIELSVPPHSLDSDTETFPAQTVVDIEENLTDPEGGMFSRALSRITSRSIAPGGPPPDGGLSAWLCGKSLDTIVSY